MNRFRTKKKGKDDASGHRQSIESESSSPFRMFGRKKTQEEDKADLDLTNVLPPSDDFRTSLLMTGLSARFSMLREQDDPTTKVGKASDDSVLFPQRQSKMADFGHNAGLQDISEVESIKTPTFSRFDAYQSDDASSTAASIMNRSKPTEGNNLFGGRQKIYRIPANGSGVGKDGGMPGRALYDDDVALSAFQKWRLAEREKQAAEGHIDDTVDPDPEPQPEPSRRRGTSSTTSSVPSVVARYSTAATSVASSIKESQSTSGTPVLERNVTRTRRLYEQGLSRDLHDQQSSALSRMDTISKRGFGSFTPDLSSSSSGTFGDRVMERRTILSKASAPNLRSYTPPVTSPPQGTAEVSTKMESKLKFGANPPLSPPMSESEDYPIISIQANDRGKAMAMGVFDRPAQKYDDSKYTQRQHQLQQGRETPTTRSPIESDPSASDIRSRSSSSAQRKPLERFESTPVKTKQTVAEESHGTFFDDSDSVLSQVVSANGNRPPQLSLERPDDDDHPAFRKSALPTPLSLSSKTSGNLSPLLEKNHLSYDPPEDSPTLGPNSGLSGMVRAHLRSDSTASSIYPPHEGEQNTQNGWRSSSDRDASPAGPAPTARAGASRSPSRLTRSSEDTEKDDEFARTLADGARRVREKLTSYVDDTDASPSTQLPDSNNDLNPPRPNALGILRSKSSRTSLFERENRDQSQTRSIKNAISSTPMATFPPSSRTSADAADDSRRGRPTQAREQSVDESTSPAVPDDNVHVGLKAFRQARRELQKMKELETKQRHQHSQIPVSSSERPPMGSRTASHDAGGPPPAMFNRMPRNESRNGSGSRAGSRAPSERDRSGSEASTSGYPPMRPMRMRNGSTSYDDQHVPSSPSNGVRRGPFLAGGMAPPYSANALDSGRQAQMDGQQYTRPRNGSLLGATASTPNLHAVAGAPPLPPINPRRKNGLARPGEDEGPVLSHRMPGGFPGADDSDDEITMEERRQRLRRATSEGNSLRARNSPPQPNTRPPLPPGNMPTSRMPGGMI